MITCEATDVLIGGEVDDASVHRALAEALAVPEERIAIIHDVADYPERTMADVVGLLSRVGGDYPTLLSIQLEARPLPDDTELGPMQVFCERLGVPCLVPDHEENPFTMWLVSPGQSPRTVSLDPTALDVDRYVLSRS